MTVYRSYSDYTTKGGGVIEGLGGGRRGNVGPIYSRVPAIPAEHDLQRTVDDVRHASVYVSQMPKDRILKLIDDLELGYIVKIRGGIFVKQLRSGKLEVYSEKPDNPVRKKMSITKPTREQREQQKDAAYRHLLAIQREANERRRQAR